MKVTNIEYAQAYSDMILKAEEKVKDFSKKIKLLDKKKEKKPVDFNRFLRQLCKRRKK